MIYKGIAGADGIGIGQVLIIKEASLDYSHVQFSGKEQEVLVLPSLKKELPHRVYVGCGEPEKVTAQVMRVCFAQAWQKAKGYAKSQVQVLLPPMEQEQAASLIHA